MQNNISIVTFVLPLPRASRSFVFFHLFIFVAREKSSKKVVVGVPMAKAQFGKVGDDWKEGEAGLV